MQRLIAVLLLCAPLLTADNLRDFKGFCTGPVLMQESGYDSSHWLGVCHVTSQSTGHVRIEASIAGPITERFAGVSSLTIRFRDDPDLTPTIFIGIHDWLGFMILPHSAEVRMALTRFVSGHNRDRKPVVHETEAAVKGRPAKDDTPKTHKIVIDITGHDLWF
jgi:hypothetical protein